MYLSRLGWNRPARGELLTKSPCHHNPRLRRLSANPDDCGLYQNKPQWFENFSDVEAHDS
jgi:hypothetical protein